MLASLWFLISGFPDFGLGTSPFLNQKPEIRNEKLNWSSYLPARVALHLLPPAVPSIEFPATRPLYLTVPAVKLI